MIAAFFDLDGTLYSGHIWLALKRHHQTHGLKLPTLYLYIITHMGLWPLYRAGLVSRARFYGAWAKHMPWLIAGLTREDADRVFQWIVEQDVLPQLQQDVVEILRQHQQEGHRVVLVSGTFQPLLERIAEALRVGDALGTRLAQRNGRYTGGIVPPLCMGRGKARRIRAFLERDGRGISLGESFAYTDSVSDLPVLEMVGHPVAVYPEEELAALAAERGWPVVGTVRSESG
jgi:HAD superfamily hydrolase (TIGR01490 family)